MKLSREQLKALREEGARYPRCLGYVVMPHCHAPIISASYEGHPDRLFTVWLCGDSAADLRWAQEDPREEMDPVRPGLWKWR